MTHITIVLSIILVLAACQADDQPETTTLTVFAASSLTDAFEDIEADFEAANPTIDVRLSFGSSSTLATQIIEGADVDVFASANPEQITRLEGEGIATEAQVMARNRVVAVVRADSNLQTLDDLRREGVRVVLAAAPTPIRVYTDMVLANLGADYANAIYERLASEEANVRQVTLKVSLGEADAGFAYATDITPDIADTVRIIEIPTAQNVITETWITPLGGSDAATTFVEFVLSDAGQASLQAQGFVAP